VVPGPRAGAGPVPETMWRSKAAAFTGQLAAYAEALESAGLPVAER